MGLESELEVICQRCFFAHESDRGASMREPLIRNKLFTCDGIRRCFPGKSLAVNTVLLTDILSVIVNECV